MTGALLGDNWFYGPLSSTLLCHDRIKFLSDALAAPHCDCLGLLGTAGCAAWQQNGSRSDFLLQLIEWRRWRPPEKSVVLVEVLDWKYTVRVD